MFIQRGLICLCVETVCLWDKSDLHEADFFVSHLTTAKAAGYSATAPPTGLASSAVAHYTP